MTLTELRYIVALADEGHFGRAAARCHVSQPTLSIAVKKLEQSLGTSLFERTRLGLGVTPLGQEVVTRARELLAQAAGIEDLIRRDGDVARGPLALGTLPSVGPYLLPQFIPLLQKTAPAMPLSIVEDHGLALARKLRSGEVDAVLVAAPFTVADVISQPLFDEPLMALLPAWHRLAEKAVLQPRDLDPDEVLLMAEGDAFREQVLEAFPHLAEASTNGALRSRVQGSTLETLRHMVASGLGVTILPLAAAQLAFYSSAVLVARPFADPAPVRTLVLAWRASFPRAGAIDILKNALTATSAAYWRYTTGSESDASLLVNNKDW